MADISVVIRIDEEDYKIMKHNIAVDNPLCPLSEKEMVSKVANGIPLPERYGKLIILSENAVKKGLIPFTVRTGQNPLSFSCQNWISEVDLSNATMAIIKIDKESEE